MAKGANKNADTKKGGKGAAKAEPAAEKGKVSILTSPRCLDTYVRRAEAKAR